MFTNETQAISPTREMIERFRAEVVGRLELLGQTAKSDNSNGCRNVDVGWRMPPPAQMFADVKWDREAGAWRFIEPLDDPQGSRFAIAMGDGAAKVARRVAEFPVLMVGGIDDLSAVAVPDWARHVTIVAGDNPAAVAAANALKDKVRRNGVSINVIGLEG